MTDLYDGGDDIDGDDNNDIDGWQTPLSLTSLIPVP